MPTSRLSFRKLLTTQVSAEFCTEMPMQWVDRPAEHGGRARLGVLHDVIADVMYERKFQARIPSP